MTSVITVQLVDSFGQAITVDPAPLLVTLTPTGSASITSIVSNDDGTFEATLK